MHIFSKKMHLKMSSATWSPYCLGLNVLKKTLFRERPIFVSKQAAQFLLPRVLKISMKWGLQ